MKLIQIKLRNFRCYRNEILINIDNLSCLIGKNDHGKSTILEALNTFFNDEIDKGDLSIDADSDTIEITCIFNNIPKKIVLDTSEETSPEEECILNIDGNLEIKKRFKVANSVGKSTYLIANHPIHENLKELLTLKNGSLKALAKQHDIDLKGITKSKNPPLRRAIRNHFNSQKQTLELKVDGNLNVENNLKAIWTNLKTLLPVFALFKVDKNVDDKDKDVQDPMKLAIKESLALPEIQTLLKKVEDEVRAKSTEVAEKTIEKLKNIDISLAEKLKSDFNKNPTWDKVFDLTLLNERNIPLNKRGSGVKRLVLLSFFQAQAERKRHEDNSPSIIYAIEEPETSQHPDHQKILIKSLIELSEIESIQVLFTTHNSNLAREIPIESLIYINRENDETTIQYGFNKDSNSLNEETLEKIINSLGVLPNPKDKVKSLLFVEGNHDINALFRYSKLFNSYNNEFICLENNPEIGFIISGGSSLKFYIENKYLDGLGKPEVHIYDNDVTEYRKFVQQINNLNNQYKIAFNTSKRELENYLCKEAIEEAYAQNSLIFTMVEVTDELDVPFTVAKLLYERIEGNNWSELDEKERKDKESRVKKILNTQAVDRMTIQRIKDRNAFEDIANWLNVIKEKSKL